MNIISVALLLAILECAARLFAHDANAGPVILGQPLPPLSWEQTGARYRRIIHAATGDLSYLVHDARVGWSVGPGRRSSNGLYLSSREGIRAKTRGASVETRSTRPRIALVGDSYTFAEEVSYDETWGSQLERQLGNAEVLNFGVPGYGVDQAYLRYEEQVRTFSPDVVVFSFISHDLLRSMTVYPFLSFPDWDLPFSKPRFVLRNGGLALLNVPALAPKEVFARASVSSLPHLEVDAGFVRADWQPWLLDFSFGARFLRPWFRGWSSRPAVSDEALLAVNGTVLDAFRTSVDRAGISALIVFLPTRAEIGGSDRYTPPGRRVLERSGQRYEDLTPCLRAVGPSDRIVPKGIHYSPRANEAVASCLAPLVRECLSRRSSTGGP
jgi:hypothetical protein